ncbi:MAG: hypothetical protein COA38_07340 [Fluviicola sp.]|nr:MAG: hypothetical protein COA38_07340 [Fluviicola sp.]
MYRIIVLFCLSSSLGFTQTAESIRSGRPGNASGAYSVGKNVFQLENGLLGYSDFSTWSFANYSLYLRYGISEKWEVNLTTDLSFASGDNQLAYGGPNVGLKYNWLDNHADRFSFGTVLSHNFGSFWNDNLNVTSINNIFMFSLTDKFGVNLNNQVEFLAESKTFGSWVILNFGYSLPKNNTIYIEGSHYFSTSDITFLRLGWCKLLTNDFQIDATIRFDQVNSIAPNRFDPGISLGFSKRFVPKK